MAGYRERIVILSLLMSLVALSIDAILPGLHGISESFALENPNHRQWTIAAIFVGLASGQFIYGPISDSLGRKITVYWGLFAFVAGSLISAFAPTYEIMLLGRVMQGFGIAAPRVISVAIVRDLYHGTEMARLMSLLMALFILVPVLAPSVGQFILLFSDWRGLYLFIMAVGIVGGFWLCLRVPETLKETRQFRLAPLKEAFIEVVSSRKAMGYTLAGACCYGGLMGYVYSAQQLFVDVYDKGEHFGFWFGGIALMAVTSTLINRWLVVRYSIHWICLSAICGLVLLTSMFLLLGIGFGQDITFALWVAYAVPAIFLLGLTFPNYTTLALWDLGHIAGMASGVVATMITIFSNGMAFLIGAHFNQTALPILIGFWVTGVGATFFMIWAGSASQTTLRQA